MENKYAPQFNGQELLQDDLELLAEAALADDRVLWELFRLAPYDGTTATKAVFNFGFRNSQKLDASLKNGGLFSGEIADGKLHVAPFRAVIGSTTLLETNPLESVRGSLSGYAVGSSAQWSNVSIASNGSGNPRWTLVYAVVTLGASATTNFRYVKDITTRVVQRKTVVLTTQNSVTLATVDGAPSGTPARPAAPVDSGNVYYIPLCYVWVPDGFSSGSSSIARASIYEVCQVATIAPAVGGVSAGVANQQYLPGGTVDTRLSGSSSALRPGPYLPPTMVGEETLIIAIQTAVSFTASHNDGDVVDNSRDWRNRLFQWFVFAGGSGNALAADRAGASSGVEPSPGAKLSGGSAVGIYTAWGFGQSFVDDSGIPAFNPSTTFGAISDCAGIAFAVYQAQITNIGAANSAFMIYVRNTDGALIFKKSTSGTPQSNLTIWLRATGPYGNFSVT